MGTLPGEMAGCRTGKPTMQKKRGQKPLKCPVITYHIASEGLWAETAFVGAPHPFAQPVLRKGSGGLAIGGGLGLRTLFWIPHS